MLIGAQHFPLRITKVYESEAYDYPVAIQESISQLSTTIGTGLTNFAASSLKGTNLPAPQPVAPVQVQHKTLPHALGRAATTAGQALQKVNNGPGDKLAVALTHYAAAWDKVRILLILTYLSLFPFLTNFRRSQLLVCSKMKILSQSSLHRGSVRLRTVLLLP